jgi:hypothetical protein
MTVQDVMAQIKQLSFEDRLQLLELLAHSVRDEWRPLTRDGSAVSRIRGLLKTDGPPPTDAELAEAYTDHLMEKYL